jgi:hypothetical protein
MTVGKNVNMTVAGDYNVVAKNFNQKILGNIDIAAKNITALTEGSVGIKAKGSMALSAKGGFIAGSVNDSASIVAKNQLALLADTGEMMVRSGQKMSFEAKSGDLVMQTKTGKMAITGLSTIITGETLVSLKSDAAMNMKSDTMSILGSSSVALEGQQTSVTGGSELGLNGATVAIVGDIKMNSGTTVSLPTVSSIAAPPDPSNPKTNFSNSSAETTQSTGTDVLEA